MIGGLMGVTERLGEEGADPHRQASAAKGKILNRSTSTMTFNIVAMICVAGMSPADCGPEPGFSRDVAVIGAVSNELWCGVEAQQDLAKSVPFRMLAEGEFIKIVCVRNG